MNTQRANAERELASVESEAGLLTFPRDVDADLARGWLDAADRWCTSGRLDEAMPLSGDELIRVESPLGSLVFKREVEQGLKGAVGALGGREPRLERSFRVGLFALEQGLRTPEPLAVIRRKNGLSVESVLVTRFVRGEDPWPRLARVRVERDTLLQDLGGELARWHAAGLRHRDLKAPNLIYSRDEPHGIWILDLVGARIVGSPSQAMRARDLGRLRASARAAGVREDDWSKLVEIYLEGCEACGAPVQAPGRFQTAIESWASKKLVRNRRRGRPLA